MGKFSRTKGNRGERNKNSLCQIGIQALEKNANWKGGKYKDKYGYIIVSLGRKGKYRYEHRLIMEKYLGRKLKKNEIVHHLNGIRNDNRIENLFLCKNPGEHIKLFHRREYENGWKRFKKKRK